MPFLSNIGTPELIVIGVVLLFFFGSKKANELAKGLGQSSKEIKKVKKEFEEALKDEVSLTTSEQPLAPEENLAEKPETDKKEEKKEGGI